MEAIKRCYRNDWIALDNKRCNLGAAQPVIFHSQHAQVAYPTRLPRMQGLEG